MAKNAVSDWSETPADNTDIGGISLAEGVMLPSAVNNAIREMMAQIKGAGFTSSAYEPGGTDVALADGGTGASLSDPGADRIMFWDDSLGQVTWLTASTGLAISDTSLSLSHLGLQSLTDPNADRISFWDDSAGALQWLTVGTGLTLSGTTLTATTAGWDTSGQSWQSVTRTSGTSYQNTTGQPIVVNARATTAGTITMEASVNNSTWVTIDTASSGNVSAVIPDDHYYRITSTSTHTTSELR